MPDQKKRPPDTPDPPVAKAKKLITMHSKNIHQSNAILEIAQAPGELETSKGLPLRSLRLCAYLSKAH